MRWQDIERLYPEPDAGDRTSAAATHLARAALGLATAPLERAAVLDAIERARIERAVTRSSSAVDGWRGLWALIAALYAGWDEVAACTGGAMLGTRVVMKKTFPYDAVGLARHLATAARARLPPSHVVVALTEVRDSFARDQLYPDARTGVLAAYLFARDIVVAPDPVAATRAWLAGEPIDLESAPPVRAVADGDDPRVMIFERFAAELADDGAVTAAVTAAATAEPWRRDLERSRLALDDLAILATIARVPMFAGWERCVDPMVACWLGAEPTAATERRFRDVALIAGRSLQLDRGWADVVRALAVGRTDAIANLTGGGGLPAFKPGRFFKDDARKLLRYLAAAVEAGAQPADVEPAWLDFLARRSPRTTPRIERGELRWKHLLALQSVIAHQLGKAPRGEAGRALQRLVTGV